MADTVDLIASIQVIIEIPETYEDLIWKFLKSIPKYLNKVHLVADTYKTNSIKESERIKRGTSPMILIQSAKPKISREFAAFMKNGNNKTRLS